MIKNKVYNYRLLERFEIPSDRIDIILDTDTYNELDDQFALIYAIRSIDRINIKAIYAAPFENDRVVSPEKGMEMSYEEILKILNMLGKKSKNYVYKGAKRFLESPDTPSKSPAAIDLVERATAAKNNKLYVVSIGAITNIASAIILEPAIIEKINIIWLGGNSHYWPHTNEFNLKQDISAARLIFDCGVPVIQIPCMPVASHLTTSLPELAYHLDKNNDIPNYLLTMFEKYQWKKKSLSKEIWDIAAIALLINPEWVPTNLIHSPILTDQLTWSVDTSRHFIKTARCVNRDFIFQDLFNKLNY